MANVKLSQIANGGALVPATDQLVAVRSGASDVLVTFPTTLAYVAKTSTYAILATDYVIEATSGSFTMTLPTAVGVAGKPYIIKNSGTGTITLATTSAQTIDGQATNVISQQYASITLISNGANWMLV